jgi:DNA-binding IclR family transcriptional regulator
VAFEHQEAVLGNSCVAAPILDSARYPVAAVSLSGPPLRLKPAERAPLVRRAAAEISRKLNAPRQPGWPVRQSPGISR